MHIVLNGKKFSINEKDTINILLKKIDIKSSKVAIEVNKVVIPKEKYRDFKFKKNDKVEVVTFIGGG
ncbi:MAG: sulfur carrier protein ThiS [Pelagibacteraceae bacterium]|jgi:sulfur carrier protein|uniref:sulfur carrier protein ThiS n=1 Tax=unclassified Candidatus Pelagibacter TaxID=2647897 RepID=UPI002562E1FE|nr:sulfur carrier protein ThiS [Pelagibacteraceae bacterium]MCI5079042.1 sulfur carrier protein ThiS [Pelagibacteraceae bacterium]